jgi:hypothetical protein
VRKKTKESVNWWIEQAVCRAKLEALSVGLEKEMAIKKVLREEMGTLFQIHNTAIGRIEESGRAIVALIDLAHQRVSALCDHLGVTTDIVPAKPAHYEVFAAKESDDKTGEDK